MATLAGETEGCDDDVDFINVQRPADDSGMVSDSDILPALRSTDAGVHASRSEQCPNMYAVCLRVNASCACHRKQLRIHTSAGRLPGLRVSDTVTAAHSLNATKGAHRRAPSNATCFTNFICLQVAAAQRWATQQRWP